MYREILIPIDGSPCSERALEQGLGLAKALGSRVTILHVVEDPIPLVTDGYIYPTGLHEALLREGKEVLRLAREQAKELGVEATERLVERGRAPKTILDEAEDADLIVIGTHGRRGFDRFVFGSVAESVLRRSPVPCMAIRCPED